MTRNPLEGEGKIYGYTGVPRLEYTNRDAEDSITQPLRHILMTKITAPLPRERKGERRSEHEKELKRDSEGGPIKVKGPEVTTRPPNTERLRETELIKGIRLGFPKPNYTNYLRPFEKPGEGLLAIREITPIAQYNHTDNLEFYGRRVTLAWDKGGKPMYYQGNALIRISK